jgi:hypothetical protein
MQAWDKRPFEIANLFNPAYCLILIQEAVRGYLREDKEGMPYPLVFLILPIVLHERTRSSLPRSVASKMHSWLADHPDARIHFPQRARHLLPYTKEAILFGLQTGTLKFNEERHLVIESTNKVRKLSSWESDAEIISCLKESQFLGRWFAQAGDSSTIFYMWGVRP